MNLAQKLQIKPGKHWLLFNAPENYLTLIEPLPDGARTHFEPNNAFDGIQFFVNNTVELNSLLPTILPLLKPDTIFWLTYPKKSSGVDSGLEMTGSWDELTANGLRVVTSVSVNETWTALRFKPVQLTKVSDSRNDNIRNNQYSAYIETDYKQITLPPDIKYLLQQTPAALELYHQLSYSNKKEYIIWVLSAKQEKTKTERLQKMIEKLLAGKKNPAEK